MAESFVRVSPDSTGKLIRTVQRTEGANTVEEQVTRSLFETAGRVQRLLYAVDAATIVAETLISLTPVTDFVAGVAATSHSVPAGKEWRILALTLNVKQNSGTAAVQRTRVAVRVNPSGAAVATSPIAAIAEASNVGAVLSTQYPQVVVPFPFGIDIPPGAGVGISQSGLAATGHINVALYIAEYPIG